MKVLGLLPASCGHPTLMASRHLRHLPSQIHYLPLKPTLSVASNFIYTITVFLKICATRLRVILHASLFLNSIPPAGHPSNLNFLFYPPCLGACSLTHSQLLTTSAFCCLSVSGPFFLQIICHSDTSSLCSLQMDVKF